MLSPFSALDRGGYFMHLEIWIISAAGQGNSNSSALPDAFPFEMENPSRGYHGLPAL
jgi:hypothetical protein